MKRNNPSVQETDHYLLYSINTTWITKVQLNHLCCTEEGKSLDVYEGLLHSYFPVWKCKLNLTPSSVILNRCTDTLLLSELWMPEPHPEGVFINHCNKGMQREGEEGEEMRKRMREMIRTYWFTPYSLCNTLHNMSVWPPARMKGKDGILFAIK